MNISREWATPLTIGAFSLMAVTGILMFFHLDTGLNKTAHEWLGWLMVGVVALHAIANFGGFKRHFVSNGTARAILIGSLLVIAGSFLSLPGAGGEHLPPPVLALKAITRAPLADVAQLAGKPVEQMIADLNKAGIAVTNPATSLESALAGDHELTGKALNTIFGTR